MDLIVNSECYVMDALMFFVGMLTCITYDQVYQEKKEELSSKQDLKCI